MIYKGEDYEKKDTGSDSDKCNAVFNGGLHRRRRRKCRRCGRNSGKRQNDGDPGVYCSQPEYGNDGTGGSVQ